MTAPLRQGGLAEPIVVNVGLGARAYDIVIGRGLLGSLGGRIKALRPSAKCAVVTDTAVAKLHLAAAEAALKSAQLESSAIVVPQGESSKSYATFETVCEAIV
ncbi:MAG: 3-dehydroquinate synthase, partial [Pseudolabrys sp.]